MEDLTVFDFDDLHWYESPNIHTALIHDFDDNALIIDIAKHDIKLCLLYYPAVKYKNKLHKLEPTEYLNLARRWAWNAYRELAGKDQSVEAASSAVEVYVRTGSDGFVDELEQLP